MKRKIIMILLAVTLACGSIVTPILASAAGTDETNDECHLYNTYTYDASHYAGGVADLGVTPGAIEEKEAEISHYEWGLTEKMKNLTKRARNQVLF